MKTDLTTEHRRQLRGRRLVGGAIATAAVCLLGIAFVASHEVTAQAQAQAEPQPMAEEVYLNVQVLKGLPVDTFNDTMGMFA